MARGRKKKNETEQQKHKITIWLTMEEKERLTARAGQIPISRFFRETLMRGRSPKQPPVIPTINIETYKELSEHLKVLQQFINAFNNHSSEEQARAIAQHSERIREMLEAYRISLITLSQERRSNNDKQSDEGKRL